MIVKLSLAVQVQNEQSALRNSRPAYDESIRARETFLRFCVGLDANSVLQGSSRQGLRTTCDGLMQFKSITKPFLS